MRQNKLWCGLLFLALILPGCKGPDSNGASTKERLTDYVNVFVGTDGPGNTYPGASVPFGMVQLSPDNGIGGWDRIAGYFWPDSTIAGFSHTHLTGTGAGDMYDLLVMPVNSRSTKSLTPEGDYRPFSLFSHDDEKAEPGYYSVLLKDFDIKCELTTTNRVGFHRYTFPKDDKSEIILDLGYAMNWDGPVDTYLKVEDDHTISGFRKSSGWARDQRVFFVAEFSRPFDGVDLQEMGKEKKDVKEVHAKKTRGAFTFKTKEGEHIAVKMALSSASIEGARKNLAAELNHWDFDKARQQASDVWEEALGKIRISGTDLQKRVFYSNMYHLHLAPVLHSDVDGSYKGADGNNQVAKGFDRYDTFSLWDTFRAAHPLFTLVTPDRVDDMIASFLAHYQETGLLPVWSMAGNETNMMIGYHAVPVIVDAYFKGFRGFDVEKAFEACKVSAMEKGREIDQYMKYGYVPVNEGHENWSVSKTLEYAYDDWCVAQFAKALGKTKDYDYFQKRSENWRHHFDPVTTFMRPKDSKGNFIKDFIPKEYTNHFCESNAWHYFWFVPQNVHGLIEAVGGRESFSAKLDSMFTFYPEATDKLPLFSTGMIGQYAHGNEPSHHVAYLYNYVGQPWKTQEMVRRILNTQYSDQPDGYCGNEDCGQMSAWMIMSAMGFYPVNPANGVYDICAPWQEEAVLTLGNEKTFTIKAPGVSDTNQYIQSVTLNGTPYNKTFITHKEILEGGEMIFEMGPKPNKDWGVAKESIFGLN